MTSVVWPLPVVPSMSQASPALIVTASPTPGVTRTLPVRQKRIWRAGVRSRSPLQPSGNWSRTNRDAGVKADTGKGCAGGANRVISRSISNVSKLLSPDPFARSRCTLTGAIMTLAPRGVARPARLIECSHASRLHVHLRENRVETAEKTAETRLRSGVMAWSAKAGSGRPFQDL
jgi:hypothetical protein